MSNVAELLERESRTVDLEPGDFERLTRRRDRKRRNQRVAAGVLGVAVFALVAIGLVRLLGSESTPAGEPRSPFEGTWVSTSDADGGTQTMTVRVFADGAVEITVLDDVATVCSGTPSTMTGTGRVEAGTRLVIPSPVYTCDDGSEPEALSGPPLQEQLRNLTFVLDAEADTLTDNLGGVWLREGAEPAPPRSGTMWPQTSLEEVRQAQELADAGNPAYTWQVDPRLTSDEWWGYLRQPGAEIVERFLREELGWEQFLFNPFQGDDGDGGADGVLRGVVYLRCAPGETNPLYPIAGQGDARGADRCAPTIDEFRYETVSLDLSQLDRRGPDGIWVVSRWAMTAPFAQADPRVVEAEATARLEDFLRARIEGEGAEGYVDVEEVPLLYATTTGAPYERSELERVSEPQWPYGDMEFEVRLFAEGGETVVEQQIFLRNASLYHSARETTENGRPVAVPYVFFDGEVTVSAADPWGRGVFHEAALELNGENVERLEFVGHPLPVENGCESGPAAADAEALARSVQADPNLVATAPVDVRVGGLEGLVMDVTVAPGASVCDVFPSTLVLTQGVGYSGPRPPGVDLDEDSRMRLYLLDLPEASATPILAIAIVAPEARFDAVIEAAAPILDSFQFHAP